MFISVFLPPDDLVPLDAGRAEQADRSPMLVQLLHRACWEHEIHELAPTHLVIYNMYMYIMMKCLFVCLCVRHEKSPLSRGGRLSPVWVTKNEHFLKMPSGGLTIHSMTCRPNAVYGLVMMMMIYLSVDCMIVTILPALQLVPVRRQESLQGMSHLAEN